MPKNVFWPATLVIMGFIFLASNIGMLPRAFWNLWPLILIIIGLGGLVTSDREDWMCCTDKLNKSKKKSPAKYKKRTARKKKK
ncbi:hypothetical protein KKE34_03815 [Patescibacteria group bacterium]|nr:hypothetical protein [Patescibacteria group bacterium]MBU1885706.1 hypothetical protein [Patescibacteria group bacterium]